MRATGCKDKEQQYKTGIHMIKYGKKWERMVIMHKSEVQINLDDQ
jgi:hypothetical protein